MKISVTIGKANQSTKSNFVHNNREGVEPTYLIPASKRSITWGAEKKTVSCNVNSEAALKKLDDQFSERSKIYEERRGRKLHAQTRKQLSIVVGVSDYANIKDAHIALGKAVKAVQNKFESTPVQTAYHGDEGHIDENGITRFNYHVHLEFCNLNKKGESLNKKCNKVFLRDLQKKACEAAGADYKKFTNSTSRVNDPHAVYRAKKEAEKNKNELSEEKIKNKELSEKLKDVTDELAKIKDITVASKEARAFLISSGTATAEDYRELKKVADSLKDQQRKGGILVADVQIYFDEYLRARQVEPILANDSFKQTQKAFGITSKNEVMALCIDLECTQKKLVTLSDNVINAEEKIISGIVYVEDQKEELSSREIAIKVRENELDNFREHFQSKVLEIMNLTNKNNSLQTEINNSISIVNRKDAKIDDLVSQNKNLESKNKKLETKITVLEQAIRYLVKNTKENFTGVFLRVIDLVEDYMPKFQKLISRINLAEPEDEPEPTSSPSRGMGM